MNHKANTPEELMEWIAAGAKPSGEPPVRSSELVRALRDEADLCRNETANDVADLLESAANEITRLNELLPGPEYHGWLRMMKRPNSY